jgi:hypothetical protein
MLSNSCSVGTAAQCVCRNWNKRIKAPKSLIVTRAGSAACLVGVVNLHCINDIAAIEAVQLNGADEVDAGCPVVALHITELPCSTAHRLGVGNRAIGPTQCLCLPASLPAAPGPILLPLCERTRLSPQEPLATESIGHERPEKPFVGLQIVAAVAARSFGAQLPANNVIKVEPASSIQQDAEASSSKQLGEC